MIVRLRRILSNPYLIGILAVLLALLVAGLLLAGTMGGQDGTAPPTGPDSSNAGGVPSPTGTALTVLRTPSPTVASEQVRVPRAVNTSRTPGANATVNLSNTLSPYIQNLGGDEGNQLRTWSPTPRPKKTPLVVPTVSVATPAPGGNLVWQGEGFYKTAPFPLNTGTMRIDLTASVLTVAQLRDASGKVVGIASAGPMPGSTVVQVTEPGTFQLEITPFGSGTWSVGIMRIVTSAGLPPVTPPSGGKDAAPLPIPSRTSPGTPVTTPVTSLPTTSSPTATTAVTTGTSTPTPAMTATPGATPTQPSRTFTGNGTTRSPSFPLNHGPAHFTYSTTSPGQFSVTLVDEQGQVVSLIALVDGPDSGSRDILVPETEEYRLEIDAKGHWEVSIA